MGKNVDSCVTDVIKAIIHQTGIVNSPTKKVFAEWIYQEFKDWDEEFFVRVLRKIESDYPHYYSHLNVPPEWNGNASSRFPNIDSEVEPQIEVKETESKDANYENYPLDNPLKTEKGEPRTRNDIDAFLSEHPEWITFGDDEIVYHKLINGKQIFGTLYNNYEIVDLPVNGLSIPFYAIEKSIIRKENDNTAIFIAERGDQISFQMNSNLIRSFDSLSKDEQEKRCHKNEMGLECILFPTDEFLNYDKNLFKSLLEEKRNGFVLCPRCRNLEKGSTLNNKESLLCPSCNYRIVSYNIITKPEKNKSASIRNGTKRQKRLLAIYLKHNKGLSAQQRDKKDHLDYTLLNNGEVDHYLEIKERTNTLNAFQETRVTLGKMLKGQELYRTTGKPTYILIKFLDCWTRYKVIPDKNYRLDKFKWRRSDHPDERMYYVDIPITELEILGWKDDLEI
jgi:hypothetical protein